jgi:hypothetical protein
MNTDLSGGAIAPRLMSERDVARYLSVSVFTLQKWRQKGIGPAFLKLLAPNTRTAPVRYEREIVDAWISHQTKRDSSTGKVNHA